MPFICVDGLVTPPPLTSSLTAYVFLSSSFSFEKNLYFPKHCHPLLKILPFFLCFYYKNITFNRSFPALLASGTLSCFSAYRKWCWLTVWKSISMPAACSYSCKSGYCFPDGNAVLFFPACTTGWFEVSTKRCHVSHTILLDRKSEVFQDLCQV